jgi:Zn-dependent protease/predicted transcriptional regulator
MRGSLKLGTIAGIGIYVHWTFALLIGWVILDNDGAGGGAAAAASRVALVLAIFGCIVLHELGHALTARRYNIPTRDITLLPIGGVARLERMPDVPIQELWVALAGPAVNVLIAIALAGLMLALHLVGIRGWEDDFEQSLLLQLLAVNIMLILFNLLPAFPMDGGRVLRALLATQLDYLRATQIAAAVGQGMAVLFAVLAATLGMLGFGFNPFILFVALFVYMGAREELRMVQMRTAFQGVPVRSAMMTRFSVLAPDDTLGQAADELLAGGQQDFPVVDGSSVVGMIDRAGLLQALAARGRETHIDEIMQRNCPAVQETDMLDKTFRTMRDGACNALPVVRNQELVGLLTLANVGELVMVQSAMRNGHRPNGEASIQAELVDEHFEQDCDVKS